MRIEDLEAQLNYTLQVCQPDEFVLRQRRLLEAVACYLIEKDKVPVVIPDEDEDDDS